MRPNTIAVAMSLACAAPALGGSHLWVINEVFSNADGTIQFIEMHETNGAAGETQLQGKWVLSDGTEAQFFFPADLPPNSTANAYLLLATPGFAALPGAPTPDYIIEENFFSLVQDTLTYWLYPTATLTFGPSTLPLDGIRSLSQAGTTAVNSPTNFDDETGTVDAPCNIADTNLDDSVDVNDLVNVITAWGTANPVFDVNHDGTVNVNDLVLVITNWGDC
jgi:hypothetical protein